MTRNKLYSTIKDFLWYTTIAVIVALAVGFSAIYLFRLGNDSVVEEACEKILEDTIGLDIDLSP